MARIYLIAPPCHNVYRQINSKNFGVLQPPLGLAYIGSFVKKHGHAVEIIDTAFCKDLFGNIENGISGFKPDFVGISATTPQITSALEIAGYIKKRFPTIKTILGGYHASALPEQSMADPNIDIVVCGEGEMTVAEILDGKDLNEIKGICFRRDGKIKINPPRPLIENLDFLPFPLWEQLPVRSYYFFSQRAIGVISGRGCPYRCSFCASSVINQYRCRMRSSANFVDEVEWLYKNYGINNLFFNDETFTLDIKRTEEICNLILDRRIRIKWTCDTRVDHLTKPILKIMRSAGCQCLRVGVESADDKVLKETGKGITLEQVERVVSWARELGIKTTAYYLLGLPYETLESLKRTLLFSRKLKTDLSYFMMHVPLPGTRTWEIAKEGRILRCVAKDWSEYTKHDKAIVESDNLSADQLTAYHDLMVKSYYFNPLYLSHKLFSIRSFRELREAFKAGATLFKMIFLKSKKN